MFRTSWHIYCLVRTIFSQVNNKQIYLSGERPPVSQTGLGSYVCFWSHIGSHLSICCSQGVWLSFILTNLSIDLETTEVRLIGLQFLGCFQLPCLWTAVTLADCQSFGIILVSTDTLKMRLIGPQSRTLGWRRSGPVYLYMLRWFNF